MVRIELTDEVVKAITMNCPLDPSDDSSKCFSRCALARACCEYWTGDSSVNQPKAQEQKKGSHPHEICC